MSGGIGPAESVAGTIVIPIERVSRADHADAMGRSRGVVTGGAGDGACDSFCPGPVSYWAYLEGQNLRDRDSNDFWNIRPMGALDVAEARRAAGGSRRMPVRAGGPKLGDVPVPAPVAPARGPGIARVMQVYTPRGTLLDVLA